MVVASILLHYTLHWSIVVGTKVDIVPYDAIEDDNALGMVQIALL